MNNFALTFQNIIYVTQDHRMGNKYITQRWVGSNIYSGPNNYMYPNFLTWLTIFPFDVLFVISPIALNWPFKPSEFVPLEEWKLSKHSTQSFLASYSASSWDYSVWSMKSVFLHLSACRTTHLSMWNRYQFLYLSR